MEKTRFTVRHPADVLGYVPHALGFRPRESLVALTLEGGFLAATLRVDLPPEDLSEADAEHYLEQIVHYLSQHEDSDGTLLAIYTSHEDGAVPGAFVPMLQGLTAVLFARGRPVRELWVVGPDSWTCLDCREDNCPVEGEDCHGRGHSVAGVDSSALATEMVVLGSMVGEHPDDLPGRERPSRSSRGGKPEPHPAEALPGPNLEPSLYSGEGEASQLACHYSPTALAILEALADPAVRPLWLVTMALICESWCDSSAEDLTGRHGREPERQGQEHQTLEENPSVPGLLWSVAVAAEALASSLKVSVVGLVSAALDVEFLRDTMLATVVLGAARALTGAVAVGVVEPGEVFSLLATAVSINPNPTRGEGNRTPQGETSMKPISQIPEDLIAVLEAGSGTSELEEHLEATAAMFTQAEQDFSDALTASLREGPEWSRMNRFAQRLEHAAEAGDAGLTAERSDLVGVHCALAWISWCRGSGSRAAAHLRLVLEHRPEHHLGNLLLEVVNRGGISPWAGSPLTSWRRHDG